MVCGDDLPLDLGEHLKSHSRPSIYYVFWSLGGFCCIITAILLLPTTYKIYKHAANIRKESPSMIMIPYSHTILMIITSFPVVVSILEYFIFLSPLNAYTNDFILASYEGLVLYLFARLLIMFLGTLQNAMDAFKNSPATKFYAVPPFGCCCKSCAKPRYMKPNDFRNLYYLIILYAFVSPLISYSNLVREYADQPVIANMLNIIKALTSMLCVYGLFGLLAASKIVLHQFNIHGKFFCIKSVVGALALPPLIIEWSGGFNGYNEQYTGEIMNEAWASMITLVWFMFLSLAFRKYFTVDDARKAMKNALLMDYAAARYETLDMTVLSETRISQFQPPKMSTINNPEYVLMEHESQN